MTVADKILRAKEDYNAVFAAGREKGRVQLWAEVEAVVDEILDVQESLIYGDDLGEVDSDNSIVITADLPDGTYSVKYEMKDGTTVDIGELVPDNGEITEPVYTNYIHEVGYTTGTRLSLSSGGETTSGATDYECTGFIPVKVNDVIRIKNIDITAENATNIIFYDSDKNPIQCNGTYHGISLAYFFALEVNDVYKGEIKGTIYDWVAPSNAAYIRLGSKSITSDSVLTVNQAIA